MSAVEQRRLRTPEPGSDGDALRGIAARSGLPFVTLEPYGAPGGGVVDPIDPAAARLLDRTACRALRLVPVARIGGGLAVAVADPGGETVRAAAALTGLEVRPLVAPWPEIERAIDRCVGEVAETPPAPAPAPAPPPAIPDAPRERLGAALVREGVIDERQLADALETQEEIGDPLGAVLTHSGAASEHEVARALAQQWGATFVDPASMVVPPEVAATIPQGMARRLQVVPLAFAGGALFLASAGPLHPDEIAELEATAGMPIRTFSAPSTSVDSALQAIHASRDVDSAANELRSSRPQDSAERVLSQRQRVVFSVAVVVGLLCLVIWPIGTIVAFNIAAILLYTAVVAYRFRLVSHSLDHEMELPVSDEEVDALDERDLPVYTILVPLYREPQMIPHLVESISALDYPPTRLDVQILLESDDEETPRVIEELRLPPHFRVVTVPDRMPKTKPKACNYGLIQARGKHVVIFDAEDEPEPDQLKKAIVAFSKADPSTVCIQCKLNYYNQDQNLLTRWFTTEYSLWFDLMLPGLDASSAPIPLGGTSNHFITERLVEVGAWDPFNVTEDADLGIRLHKAGYKTAVVDSTTYEEANSELVNWIRQRSRWVKGYIQTWLVQMRHPLRLRRELGWRGWVSFQLTVGGTAAVFLLNPIYWLLTTVWLLTEADVIRSGFPGLLFYAGGLGFYIGNFLLAYMAAAAASRRGYHGLVKYAMLIPIYWVLMSIGAWKGFIQLFTKPFYWEKTEHGLHLPASGERVS